MSREGRKYRAALYLRLSREDGLRESASIAAQRKMLQTYAEEQGFPVCGEYVDDGYSGTNFERPGWKRMIADIEAGRVNLVITKDLSRLGRDYIEAGRYTEIYFPAKNVRYIAVNDGYDSEREDTDIAPFKNVINEMYARDTSRKIRSAFRTKMMEGDFIGNFAPYGYQKDPEDKHHLLPDPEAAGVVREIFQLAEAGRSPAETASILNRRGILTPAEYRRTGRSSLASEEEPRAEAGCVASKKGQQAETGRLAAHGGRRGWTSSMVCKLLGNVVYTGCMAQGKTTKPNLKSNASLAKPKEEWFVVPGRHAALVSEEVFERVQDRRVSRRRPPEGGFYNVFSGLACCGDCGLGMSVTAARSGGHFLVCGRYKRNGKQACSDHRISYSLLREVVCRELREMISLTKEELRDQGERLGQKNVLDSLEQLLREETIPDVFLRRLVKRIEIGRREPGPDGRCRQAIRIYYSWKGEGEGGKT